MSDKVNKNEKPVERPIIENQNPDIIKGGINESIKREHPSPLSWRPTVDQTDSTPPDGGSGVGNQKD